MSVHVLADTSAKLDGIRAALERKYKVTSQLLTGASVRHGDCDALVVKADLRVVENIAALRKTLGSLAHVPKRIFLLDQTVHLGIAQAYALGATLVLAGPVNQARLIAVLSGDDDPDADLPANPSDESEASSIGATAIMSMFTSVTNGTAIDVKGTKEAGRKIADHVAERG